MGACAVPQREAVPADAAGIAGDRALRHEDAARQAGAAGGILDVAGFVAGEGPEIAALGRSEEHTSELQSLMRISYAVFCLKKKNILTTSAYIGEQYVTHGCVTSHRALNENHL